jgi:transposase
MIHQAPTGLDEALVIGRPSVVPGRYFRLLLVGYFEGIDSGTRDRLARDQLAGGPQFSAARLDEARPRSFDDVADAAVEGLETRRAVFTWVQQRLVEAGPLKGKTVAIDATTSEANAAMRSIVRRDTRESYQEFLTRLARASAIKTPTRETLARLDQKWKKGSP